MKREYFVRVVEETLDSLPQEFRKRIHNVAVLVEGLPPNQRSLKPGQQRRLLLGVFHGVPTTKKSIFDLSSGPDHIVLLSEEYRSGLLKRCGSRRTNPADGHP
jgi:predicted Zn-dependent protease with MMP-like domain